MIQEHYEVPLGQTSTLHTKQFFTKIDYRVRTIKTDIHFASSPGSKHINVSDTFTIHVIDVNRVLDPHVPGYAAVIAGSSRYLCNGLANQEPAS